MKQQDHLIVGIHVRDRVRHASQVQKILTSAGRHIRTRVGLHDTHPGSGDNGLILVELIADAGTRKSFLAQLKKIRGLDVKAMLFQHD